MSFLYQISTQAVTSQAAIASLNLPSLLQLNQHYRLTSTDNQLLLVSATAVAGLNHAEADLAKAQRDNAMPSSTPSHASPVLRLFAGELSGHILQKILHIVAANDPAVNLRCLQPHTDLTMALEFALPKPLNPAQQQQLAELAAMHTLELLYLPTRPTLSQPGLLVMDMDSTAIQIECIDEIAILAGVGAEVAKVTAQAMNGQLDFAQSLIARVATLKGADSAILAQVLAEMPIMPGLAALVSQLQQHNWQVAIASGGFTYFTQALQQRFALTASFANQLEIIDGTLTGKVIGDIVDAQTKATVVAQLATQYQIEPSQTVAIGDGANDIPMLKAAHYGVAFHAKAAVQAQAKYAIKQGSLLQLLYLFD